mgnify:CR=1 FL=1
MSTHSMRPSADTHRSSRRRHHGVAALGKAVAIVAAMLLAGCSGDDHSDLQAYVARVKAKKAGRIKPLPEFKSYETFAYKADGRHDPFAPFQEEAQVTQANDNGDGPRPDLHRHKEALESFPLDGLKFVGTMERKGQEWAIISAPDKLVYRVKTGNYVGQNYGEIMQITEDKISIREIVPNGLGGWVKRDAALALAE